jgi:serine/threonine protein kinase
MVNVDTILVTGGSNEIEESCKSNEIIGIQSIKTSEETGDEPNEFVHVIKAVLDKYDVPIIVKIHDSVSYFVEKEITALNKLSEFENSVKKICDFSCLDDKARWKHMIRSPIKFCNNKKDKLHIIILEYIENGDLELFFSKNPSKKVLCSLFLQIELTIIRLALDYRISHGDLHSGNILIHSTEKSRIHYKVLGKEYRITSYGILPKLIDFGRSTSYIGKIHPDSILDDIYICLSILALHINNEELKNNFKQFILNESKANSTDLHRIIMETKRFFDI